MAVVSEGERVKEGPPVVETTPTRAQARVLDVVADQCSQHGYAVPTAVARIREVTVGACVRRGWLSRPHADMRVTLTAAGERARERARKFHTR